MSDKPRKVCLKTELADLRERLAAKEQTITALIKVQNKVEKALSAVGLPDADTPTPVLIRRHFGKLNKHCRAIIKERDEIRAQLVAAMKERDAYRALADELKNRAETEEEYPMEYLTWIIEDWSERLFEVQQAQAGA